MNCIQQLEDELKRRRCLHSAALERQRVIQEKYTRLHQHVYQLQVMLLYTELLMTLGDFATCIKYGSYYYYYNCTKRTL